MSDFSQLLRNLQAGQDMAFDDAYFMFDAIFAGGVPDHDITAFLLALTKKGETVFELYAAVQALRDRALTIQSPPGTIDIVGTGGDLRHTLNISTATALVVAACGVPVAKHGNRAVTSSSGSSDVLGYLGINLEPELHTLEECLYEANICFLFAPRHHSALRHVAHIRKKLGIRTIFNLIGPLSNPANVKRYLVGAYELEWLGPMAEVLKMMGCDAAWLVHGHDGLDEITTTDMTDVVEMRPTHTRHFTLNPEQFDIPRVPISAIRGGDAQHNAAELDRLLDGARGAYRDIVLMNAAAALVVADKCPDMRQGMDIAAIALDNGAAQETLQKIIRISNRTFSS